MFVVLSAALLSSGNVFAAAETVNVTDSNLTQNIAGNVTNTSDSANVADSANTTNLTNTTHSTNSANSETNSTNDAAKIQQTEAAGDNSTNTNYTNIIGIWLRSSDVDGIDITKLINAHVTDIFVKINSTNYQSVLNAILLKVKGTGIRINAWVTCFQNSDGTWVDPQGKYSYQVAVPYTATVQTPYVQRYKGWYTKAYTVKFKKWYKSGKKWRYHWVYQTRYKKVYGWTTRTAYKTSYVTKYNYETRYGNSTAYNDNLINFISTVTKNYNINGIHLDYARYPGTAYKHENGTEAITSFVKRVYTTVKSIKPSVAVSAALMPEGSVNAYYYGQNYTQLANYLDFMVPMVYKGNYGYNSSTGTNSHGINGTDWIGSTVAYIVSQAGGTPVVAGIQAYRSDNNVTPIPASELQNDINAALSNGSSGYVLFRYGLIDWNFATAKAASSTDPSNTDSTTTGTTTTSGSSTVPSSLQQYLQATANCQVNDPSIISLATSITYGLNSTYDKAAAIFNWVRDNLGYSFYYNTKYGAVGTLKAMTGNCCDATHLLVALERSVGIPARYEHIYAQFSSGSWYGHVIGQVWVNGVWYNADTISYRNTFGVINNWNTATATYEGTYSSLPF